MGDKSDFATQILALFSSPSLILPVDRLAEQLNLTVADILPVLLELEMNQQIRTVVGGYQRCASLPSI